MKRKSRKQRLVSDINITPFTDVILVLLVIFMITTPLITESSIKVKLPGSKGGKPFESAKQVAITVTSEGLIYMDDELVTRKEIKEKISTLHKNNPDLRIFLRADRLARFKDIVEVLDPLTELGITKMDIATTIERP